MRSLLAGLLCALTLTSCSSDKPSAADVAEQVAEGLMAGKPPAGVFDGETPQAEYDAIVAGLGDVEPEVDVADVTEEDEKAEATLAWSWTLGDQTWEYESTMALADDGEAWHATWAPSIVEPTLADGESLDSTTRAARPGRHPRRRRDPPRDRAPGGPVRDRQDQGLREARARERPACRSPARRRGCPVREGGAGRRRRGVRRGDRAAAGRRRAGSPPAYYDIPGAVGLEDELPLRADARVRRAHPRPGRAGHRRARRGVRRAAPAQATSRGSPACSSGTTSS